MEYNMKYLQIKKNGVRATSVKVEKWQEDLRGLFLDGSQTEIIFLYDDSYLVDFVVPSWYLFD